MGNFLRCDETEYYGSWVDGKQGGDGSETLKDGTIYDGQWRSGRRNG